MQGHGTVVRRWAGIVSALVTGLLLAAGGASAAAAPPPSTYVSLGDSLAFGYQPDLVAASDFNPADYVGYAEDFAAMHPGMTLANFGCPGETTDTLINGGCSWTASGLPLHVAHPGSQLAAATAYLSAHPETSLISVDIGSNDLLALIDGCHAAVSCIGAGLPATIGHITSNYAVILGTLHAAAPNAKLVVFNLYNPLALALPGSDPLLAEVNGAIGQMASSVGASVGASVAVADAFSVMNGKAGSPSEHAFVCTRTWECTSYANIHPTALGYKQMAIALLHAAGH